MNSSDVLKEVRSYYNFLSILKIQISLSYVLLGLYMQYVNSIIFFQA